MFFYSLIWVCQLCCPYDISTSFVRLIQYCHNLSCSLTFNLVTETIYINIYIHILMSFLLINMGLLILPGLPNSTCFIAHSIVINNLSGLWPISITYLIIDLICLLMPFYSLKQVLLMFSLGFSQFIVLSSLSGAMIQLYRL